MTNNVPAATLAVAIDHVATRIQTLYASTPKPRADDVQKVLDEIEDVPDEKIRTVLFVTAKQNLGGDLKDLVIGARQRALRRWGDIVV